MSGALPPPLSRPWQRAELAPFVVVRMSWEARDLQMHGLNMVGESWVGWMASAPKDWAGVAAAIETLAPPGAGVSWSIAEGPESSVAFLSPRLAPGLNAPWLDTMETIYQDNDSPRMLLLDATWEIKTDIPREWSSDWFKEMTRIAIEERQGALEKMLPLLGFEDVEPMGLRWDLSGNDHWSNIAADRWGGWVARREARELSSQTFAPCASAAKTNSL